MATKEALLSVGSSDLSAVVFSPAAAVERLKELIRVHDEWYTRECICLNAADGAVSPLARQPLSSHLIDRAAAGFIGKRAHTGLEHVDEIDKILVTLARKLFNCNYVEYRPLSCVHANAWVLRLLTEIGDNVLAPDMGHPCYRVTYAGYRGLKVHEFHFNEDFNVDLDIYEKMVKQVRPTAIFIGHSYFFFPYPLREMAKIAHEFGARIMYDAAHVLGLIAGKQFQQPLQEGADVMTSSTGKVFSASLGGLILHNDPEFAKRSDALDCIVSGRNSGRLASLAMVLAEHLAFGEMFYSQVLRNAQALARGLHEAGFTVFGKNRGFTQTHMLLMECSDLGECREWAAKMRQVNIVFTPYSLPKYGGMCGFRLGTNPCTAYGMKEEEMKIIADFFKRVLLDHEDPSKVARDVKELRGKFTERHFCFQ